MAAPPLFPRPNTPLPTVSGRGGEQGPREGEGGESEGRGSREGEGVERERENDMGKEKEERKRKMIKQNQP
jgi:hypothetical protein